MDRLSTDALTSYAQAWSRTKSTAEQLMRDLEGLRPVALDAEDAVAVAFLDGQIAEAARLRQMAALTIASIGRILQRRADP